MFKRTTISILLLLMIACSKPIELKNFDKQSWAQDKDGCAGIRKSVIENLMNQKDKLLGKDQEQIIELLGKPDRHELYKRTQYFLVYYIEPGVNCLNYNVNKKTSNLSIRFNALGRVNEVVYYK